MAKKRRPNQAAVAKRQATIAARKNKLAQARRAKQLKGFVQKAAASKRTKVAQNLKKQFGITADTAVDATRATVEFETPAQAQTRQQQRASSVRQITIISRVGQPMPTVTVQRLPQQTYPFTPVSSSWIAGYSWNNTHLRAYFETLPTKTQPAHGYVVYIPFDVFEEWYFAHSKGTYFNWKIKDKYPIVKWR